MNKADVRLAKKKILKCLTEEFVMEKRRGKNQPLFIADGQFQGRSICAIDLELVMDRVTMGLYMALADSEAEDANPQAD